MQDYASAQRVFYLSIPPSIFTAVAAAASASASSRSGWTRFIVEKPFGRDSESFRALSDELYRHLTEEQLYRIDHYLGKELIENLTARVLPVVVCLHVRACVCVCMCVSTGWARS